MALTKIPANMLSGVDLGNSVRVNLGNSDNLALFHTGGNGVIHNTTGALRIRANTLNIQDYTNEDAMITATSDGSVDLYHNNVRKFSTSSSGISVVGDVAAATLTTTSDISINNKITFTYNDHYLQTGTNSISFKNAVGTSYATLSNTGLSVTNDLTVGVT